MIEDVTTSGKSMEETVPKVRGAADVNIIGLMVSLDRQEKGKGDRSALKEVSELYGFPAGAIVTMAEVQDYLKEKGLLEPQIEEALKAYYDTYGAKA